MLAACRYQRTSSRDIHVSICAIPRPQPLLARLASTCHIITDKQNHHFAMRDLRGNVVEVNVFGDGPAPAAPLVHHTLQSVETRPRAIEVPIRFPAVDSLELQVREL